MVFSGRERRGGRGAGGAATLLVGCQTQPASTGSGHEGHGATASAPAATGSMSASFNDADVAFAQGMLPHHAQAVEMADIVLAKPGLAGRVDELATEIKAAQQPEIDTITSWLAAWGAPVMADHASMGHGADGGGMPGMLTPADLDALRAADAGAASRIFLEQMIAHHEGAISMAQMEVATGANQDAVAMAQAIVTSQSVENDRMRELLATL